MKSDSAEDDVEKCGANHAERTLQQFIALTATVLNRRQDLPSLKHSSKMFKLLKDVKRLSGLNAIFRCTLPIKLSSPVSKYWAEDGQAGHQDALVNLSACVQPNLDELTWPTLESLESLESLRSLFEFVWGGSAFPCISTISPYFHLVRHPRTDASRVAMVVLSTKASTWSKQGHHGREEVPAADARSILFFDASIQAAKLWPALLLCFESFPARSWLNFTSLPWYLGYLGFGRVGAWMVS